MTAKPKAKEVRDAVHRLRLVAIQFAASQEPGGHQGLSRDILLVTRELEAHQKAVRAGRAALGGEGA